MSLRCAQLIAKTHTSNRATAFIIQHLPSKRKSISKMQFTLLIFTNLLATAFALPQGPIHYGPGPWYMTNYNPGCDTSPAGCAYSFNINYMPPYNSDPSTTEPAFSTSCKGTDIQGGYKACADMSVSSKDVPGIGNSTLFVQHVYNLGEALYTVTGNATITDFQTEGQSFVIYPSEIIAVA